MTSRLLKTLPALPLTLASLSSHAQEVVIAYAPGATAAVPLSPWMAAATVLALLVVARVLGKSGRAGTLAAALVGVLAVGAAVVTDPKTVSATYSYVSVFTDKSNDAYIPETVGMGYLPDTIGVCWGFAWVQNGTGTAVNIKNISLVEPMHSMGPITRIPEADLNPAMQSEILGITQQPVVDCNVGDSLQPDGQCKVVYRFDCMG